MVRKLNIAFARTCAFQTEHFQVGTWLLMTGLALRTDPRIGKVSTHVDTRFRIHTSRNWCARWAIQNDVDFLCFVDGDMHVDYRLHNPLLPDAAQPDAAQWARPFLQSSLEFMLSSDAGVIGAPAVSGPPDNKINTFIVDRLPNGEIGDPRRMQAEDMRTTQPCFLPVVAIGTGVMLIDVNVFRRMPEPWFEDVEDEKKYEVHRSQDCQFCFKCQELDIPVYANLFAPARHLKFQGQDPPCWEPTWPSNLPASTATPSLPSPAAARSPAPSPSKVSLWLPSASRQDFAATSGIGLP